MLGSKNRGGIELANMIILVLIVTIVGVSIIFDHNRVKKDYHNLELLLEDARLEAMEQNRPLHIIFKGKKANVLDHRTGILFAVLNLPTLHGAEHFTTASKKTIFFPSKDMKRRPAKTCLGEVTLKSWFGFTKHLWINNKGFVQNGLCPNRKQ